MRCICRRFTKWIIFLVTLGLTLATGVPVIPTANWGTHAIMPGRKLSLLAYSPEVRDVTLTGAKWTLTRATLTYRYPLGCSNEFTADMAEVTFREGLLMVCFSADKNP